MVPAEIPLVVAVFPARAEIADDSERFRDLRLGIEEKLRENGMDSVDLLAAFKEAGDQPAAFFPHDGHWTARGHEIAGEAIARWLSEHNWVQPNQ